MDQFDLVGDFLRAGKSIPIVDVRTPSEFSRGHIPGAVNLPLFDDDERKIIGTTYVQIGRQEAVDLGSDIALPKVSSLVAEARKIAVGRKLLVHCWRGGMRSNAVATLLNLAGLEAAVLKGGYKAFRGYIHSLFEKDARLVIIGGLTGTGKSEVLRMLKAKNEQILDLETLANHKGSVFGGLARSQPTTEQFENRIHEVLSEYDLSKIIFVEDESMKIGWNVIPEPIFRKMKEAPMIHIEMSRDERLKRIIDEYGSFEHQVLIDACGRIKKRMGFERYQHTIDAIGKDEIPLAASMLLDYYDRLYNEAIDRRTTPKTKLTAKSNEEFDVLCRQIIEVSKNR